MIISTKVTFGHFLGCHSIFEHDPLPSDLICRTLFWGYFADCKHVWNLVKASTWFRCRFYIWIFFFNLTFNFLFIFRLFFFEIVLSNLLLITCCCFFLNEGLFVQKVSKSVAQPSKIRHPKDLTGCCSGAFISDFKHILHIPLFLLFWKGICLMWIYHFVWIA